MTIDLVWEILSKWYPTPPDANGLLVQKSEKIRMYNIESAVCFALFNDTGYVNLASTCE